MNGRKADMETTISDTPRTDALVCVQGHDNLAVNTKDLIALCRELERESSGPPRLHAPCSKGGYCLFEPPCAFECLKRHQ